MPNKIDRNASSNDRIRRVIQRLSVGAATSTIKVSAPITNGKNGLGLAISTGTGLVVVNGELATQGLMWSSTTLSTVAPLFGGGYLSTDLTLFMTEAGPSTSGWLSSTDFNRIGGSTSTGGGTVTSVALAGLPSTIFTITGSPVTSSGTLTFTMSEAGTSTSGWLSSTDWNTFNSALPSSTSTNFLLTSTSTLFLPSSTTLATTGPITGGGNLSTGLTIGITQVSSTTNGFLSSTQFNALAVPGGSTTDVQFNSSGVFAGTNFFTTNGATYVTIAGNLLMSTGSIIEFNGLPGLQAITANFDFFGGGAGNLTMTGSDNAAFGFAALNSNTTGGDSAAFGFAALTSNTTGGSNSAFGFAALTSNTTGSFNSAFGVDALLSNTTGGDNAAFGVYALLSNTTGSFNSAFGYQALFSNTTPDANTAIGAQTLYSNSIGTGNIAIGYQSLYSNTTGVFNLAVGQQALYSNTTANFNVAIGYLTLFANTTGASNLAIGYEALTSNTTGLANLAIGFGSMQFNSIGGFNVSIGATALFSNTSGNSNTAMGQAASFSNTTGTGNLALGVQALYGGTTGNYNTGIGTNTLYNNVTGGQNLAIGYQSLINTTGNSNIQIGGNNSAAGTITSGSANILIGNDLMALPPTGSNNLDIGNLIFGTGTNIGNTVSGGAVGINIITPAFTLDVAGPAQAYHFKGNAAVPPTIAAGTGAGTGPTIAILGSDAGGKITLTTGTLPSISATILTVTFNLPYTLAPYVVFSPANGAAAALSGLAGIYATATTTTFVFTSDTTALTAATQYVWNYAVMG